MFKENYRYRQTADTIEQGHLDSRILIAVASDVLSLQKCWDTHEKPMLDRAWTVVVAGP